MMKVAFICLHNSCRSQIAEALGKQLFSNRFESYSAGTEVKDRINPDAVRIMKERYGIDMEKTPASEIACRYPAGGYCDHHGLQRALPQPCLVSTGKTGVWTTRPGRVTRHFTK